MGAERSILIVDELAWFRELVAVFLARSGRVLAAGSAAEALTIARKERPDLVVADFDMPGGDGAALCERIRRDALLAYTPVIVVIGTDDPEHHARATRAGATDVLTKPLSRTTLIESVSRLTRSERPIGRPRVELAQPVHVRIGGRDCQGVLRNLSRSGAFVELAEPLPSGPEIELDFLLPDSHRGFAPSAQVVWSRARRSPEARYGHGLRFLRLEPRALRALDDFVADRVLEPPSAPATA